MSRSFGDRSVTWMSSMRISPAVTSSSPARSRRIVDLPQPDGPTSTMNSPSRISSETSSTATTSSSNTFVTPSRTIVAISLSLLPSGHGAEAVLRPRETRQSIVAQPLLGQGGSDPRPRSGRGSELIEAEQRRADDGRRVEDRDVRARRDPREPAYDPFQETGILAAEHAAAEDDVDIEIGHPKAPDRRAAHGDDLVGLSVDHAPSDRVVLGGGAEDQRRELHDPLLRQPAEMQGLHHLPDTAVPERPRAAVAAARRLPTTVLGSDRVPEGRLTEVRAPAPVTGQHADRREAEAAAVRRDARAVRAVAAHDGDAPGPVGPGPQDRERVVANDGGLCEAAPAEPARDPAVIPRQIGAGQAIHPDVRDRPAVELDPGVAPRGRDRLRHQFEVDGAADAVVLGARDPRSPEDRAVTPNERSVDLRPARVDDHQRRPAHSSSSTGSSSTPTHVAPRSCSPDRIAGTASAVPFGQECSSTIEPSPCSSTPASVSLASAVPSRHGSQSSTITRQKTFR